MSGDQQTARVNVSDEEWIQFRTLAMQQRRSIADYLGELVHRELSSSTERPSKRAVGTPKPARRRASAPVLLSDQELLTALPGSRPRQPQ